MVPSLVTFPTLERLVADVIELIVIHPTFLYSQARYESQRIQMESELAVQLEQRVTERLAEAQENSLRQAASLRDHHR